MRCKIIISTFVLWIFTIFDIPCDIKNDLGQYSFVVVNDVNAVNATQLPRY